jgi:hypothetical protein
MFSVSLDEAMAFRLNGRGDKACQVLTIVPALCDKFTTSLQSLLRAMSVHARHFGTAPSMAALNPENFQNSKCQRSARFHSLLSRVLLSKRSQFIQKLSVLGELVEDLREDFSESAESLGRDEWPSSDECWIALDTSQYDLNTCLRETAVLLKCFLVALPDHQLADFESCLVEQPLPCDVRVPSPRHLAHRRLAALKGQ